MNKELILVVEDDIPIKNLITTTLKSRGYKSMSAHSGTMAITLASSYSPDVILLDLGLPDMDGAKVIEKIRTWTNTPIIVISARSEDVDKINALDLGADDYLTKPFSVEELVARIRVATRRNALINNEKNDTHEFVNGSLKINYAFNTASIGDEELHLTPIEFKLLSLLSKNVGRVLTHKFILDKVWGATGENENSSLRVFMASLRKKLSKEKMNIIQTHVGVGYRMIRIE